MSKLLTIAAFVTGYVLGARAGRGRYEQIMQFVAEVRGTEAGRPRTMQDEIFYSAGPDVEATVEELIR
jgi:hypothetical protein